MCQPIDSVSWFNFLVLSLQPTFFFLLDLCSLMLSRIDRLATVELQLIMHGLECREILRLARCCTRMMRAGEAAFAWKCAPTMRMDSSRIVHTTGLSLCLLLHHASVALTLLAGGWAFDDRWLLATAGVVRLAELDASLCPQVDLGLRRLQIVRVRSLPALSCDRSASCRTP